MRNYLAAECYKTFRRKYFYIILAVCLGLEAVLLWGYWTTWKWGNSNVDFYSTAIMVPFMLSIGLYATIVTGDIVFSEQYKNNTLKNEVSYGLSRLPADSIPTKIHIKQNNIRLKSSHEMLNTSRLSSNFYFFHVGIQ